MSCSPSPPLPPLSPPTPLPNSSVLPCGPFHSALGGWPSYPRLPKLAGACPVSQASALTLPLERISWQHTTVTHIFQECGARGPFVGGPGRLKWRFMGKTSFPTGMSRRVSAGSLLSSASIWLGHLDTCFHGPSRATQSEDRRFQEPPHLSRGLILRASSEGKMAL